MTQKREHLPIMVAETLQFFADRKIKVFFDGTLGAGGHAKAILQAHPEIETYIGCDQDPEALEIAQHNLQEWSAKMRFVKSNFQDLDKVLLQEGFKQVDGFFLT
jgi:16S rRNA (cytosine1402-N4)-methyltransferase